MAADVRVFDDAEALGEALAGEIRSRYERVDGRFVLGCPGGRSLRSTYRALARRREPLDRLVVVMMDEYVVDGVAAPAASHDSCRSFARSELAAPLGIDVANVLVPDPAEPAAYDEQIAELGGIDLFLLASGASDGHVAFLPPGSPLDGRTSVVTLAESTRRDNVATFPEFTSAGEVPSEGVSVGLGTIRGARALRLVVHGRDKRAAAARVLDLDRFDPAWPASVVHAHPDAEIWLDREAAP